MITRAQIAATFFLALFCGSVFAQIDIADAIRTSETSKPTLAIYDIRPANSSITAIQNAIERAFKVHYDRLKITQQLAPSPLPVVPPRPTFKYVQGQLGTFLYPDCPQASTIVFAMDVTMLKYGEMTILRACVFQYQEGLRLSIYANFTQKSGAVSPDVMGATLGRIVTNAVGLGDTSKFILETFDDIEGRIRAITPNVSLVEMQPARVGRGVVPDPANIQASSNIASPKEPSHNNQSQARRELSSMGLTYYDQEQFFKSIQRGDRLACELFLQASAVSPIKPDKSGKTPLQMARTPEIREMHRNYSAQR